jgi:hypothetical protein
MFTYEFIVAAALLTSPADTAPLMDNGQWILPLRGALIEAALGGELLDRREERFTLVREDSLLADLAMLQGRFQEFLSAPFLEECQRFPERALVSDFLAFNRAYRSDLCARMLIDPVHAEDLRNAILETDQLYRAWDAVRDSRCEYYYITVRRQALNQLKDMIGNEAFYRGQLPPHVPVWRFAEN